MSDDDRIIEFTTNINVVLAGTERKSFKGFQMVFIPILTGDHYYLLFFNLKTKKILIINIEGDAGLERYHGNVDKMISTFSRYLSQIHPNVARKLKTIQPVRLKFPWQTIYNGIDCGIFMMRHMETYNGKLVTARGDVEREVKEFADLDEDERVRLEEKAVERIGERLDGTL
ncbi:putative Ulp1 protease family catalytic domain, papain-like cysteine peptidase superfamily [Helianthus anomalus]